MNAPPFASRCSYFSRKQTERGLAPRLVAVARCICTIRIRTSPVAGAGPSNCNTCQPCPLSSSLAGWNRDFSISDLPLKEGITTFLPSKTWPLVGWGDGSHGSLDAHRTRPRDRRARRGLVCRVGVCGIFPSSLIHRVALVCCIRLTSGGEKLPFGRGIGGGGEQKVTPR